MTVISVEVPDNIAKKFNHTEVVSSDVLYTELDNQEWKTVKVWEKASVVLDYLRNIK